MDYSLFLIPYSFRLLKEGGIAGSGFEPEALGYEPSMFAVTLPRDIFSKNLCSKKACSFW